MFNCFGVNLSLDELNRIFRFFVGQGYIRNLRDNIKHLEEEMENLKATQQEVKNKVEREEAQHRQRHVIVKLWLNRVERTDIVLKELLRNSDDHLEELFLWDYCSRNVCSSYGYGKRVFLLWEDIKRLKLEGEFKEVTGPALRYEDQRQQPQEVQRQQPQEVQIEQPQAGQIQQPVVTPEGCIFNVGQLTLSSSDNARYWTFMSITEPANGSAFEVAKLRECYYLDVSGKFYAQKLTSGTRYEVVFVVKVENTITKWDDPAKAQLMVPGKKLQERELQFYDLDRNEWVEIQAGVFVAQPHKKQVAFYLYQKDTHKNKTGLVVKGAIVRPME